MEFGGRQLSEDTEEVILDLDATDSLIHGLQEGRFDHGYYREYGYLPLYGFCGTIPLWAPLRSRNLDAASGTVDVLERVVGVLRKRLGEKLRIIVRGDSGFCREEI